MKATFTPSAVAVVLGTVAGALAATAAAPSLAQGWAQGRPADLETSPLAPHAGKLTVTPPEEIPLGNLHLPPGFSIEIWAHGMPGARMMEWGDDGTLFVGTRGIGRVYAVTDKGDSRESRIIAEGLTQPNGVAFKDGSLYVGAINRILRFDDIETHLDAVPDPVELTDAFDLPPDGHHGWKFLAFGPDGKLYVPVGAPCNGCEIDKDVHGTISRYDPDGANREILARGVRNSVGFDFHPETGELWFTDNNQDWISEQGPHDELNRIAEPGADFGYPYCHANGVVDPHLGKADSCDGVVGPAALMGPHTAPLGMRFYTGAMFPADYRNAIFVARRGSWNRTVLSGFDVMVAMLSTDGETAAPSPFLVGFLDTVRNSFWGRPVDVIQAPDGALLVADEQNGAIYRVSYEKPA